MDLLFATHNSDKMKEIHEIMDASGFRIISLADLGISHDVIEDCDSFEGNALKKASEIALLTGLLTLSDDSGIEIDYFGKEPGVNSARYMGRDTPYSVKNSKILDMMAGVPFEKRSARFVCVIAAAMPSGDGGIKSIFERGVMEGFISESITGENGFGYDPIFYVKEYGTTTANLPVELKNKISHRGKALRQIRPRLKDFFEA